MRIDIEDLTFHYPSGVVALQNVELSICASESVAIIGENGAGKTTLAKHLNGLLKPTKGRILIGEWDTREHSVAQLSRRVGYVFQNPDDQLFARSVWAEVSFGPRNLGLPTEALKAHVAAALARVELEAEADRHPYDLHVSKRKFVALAATLAMESPVVVLDEPTTGQDAEGISKLGRIVEKLKVEGHTVIAISHDLDFCAEHFERVIVMSKGGILADGHAEDVFSQQDLLQQAGLGPPQMVRLATALNLSSTPRTVEAFVAAWYEQRGSVGGSP